MSLNKPNKAIGPQVRQKHNEKTNKQLVILVALSLFISMQVGTQFVAYKLHFSDELGFSLNHVYFPWQSLWWSLKYHHYYPDYFNAAFGLMAMSGSLFLMLIVFVAKHLKKENISEYLHGSARWANRDDLKNAGLFGNEEGVYVGAIEDEKGDIHYLRHNGPEHILTYAPTRSGKGVGLVIPTLLSWKQSCVITDLKGELWALTAGWRQKHANNKVIRFEPATLKDSARWNPLDEIRVGTEYEVGDVQNLATLVIDPDGKGLETHWQKTSQALLVGFILHAIYKLKNQGEPATFPNIDRMLVDPNTNIADLLIEMTQYPHVDGKTHSVISASARDMIDRPEEEAGSVLSTLKSYLALYRDPVVAHNVSGSDFCIKDLMHHASPVSLYIVTQPNDKARLQPLVRVMLNMVVRLLADKMEFERVDDGRGNYFVRTKKTYKHRLLCMIDEFPSLGKLDILQESLAFVAGYGLKFYLICQDINQLKSRERGYGPDETITSNCHIQNAYPPNRIETAEHLSKLTGQTTIVKEHITTSGKRFSTFLNQISKTKQEVSRPLLTVDECQRMPGPKKDENGLIKEAGDMVVYVAGFPAIYGKQPLYFKDPVFIARASVEAPEQSDILRARLREDEEIRL
ncbi:TPA: type IV secretory system conjugative DNA transfer family protein [Legionella pneumophila]|uniref:Conjugal transfer coupling protein TraG n=1 Tax=Legionella jordanis TaxID=456 RepID=A0A0W0VBQ1_9GAMM|nr:MULTISPECIES: type IV secretory system conjugative DNA transfer family protein [Legionella]KTD17309.1 conjugal transfer coupling protein TraG [Legionella jordanis]MCK1847870.1 type IV secretory system conjugative DNA transfer family protein [Legionella pneumophila]RMX01921.1 conjugal transfer protein TraG [Legionella jordanis]RMX17711.1 conjugal transfer protein TraG [Legionella jordanis]VEH11674.1 Conjugal transfer protein traG [Legionella jordanis]